MPLLLVGILAGCGKSDSTASTTAARTAQTTLTAASSVTSAAATSTSKPTGTTVSAPTATPAPKAGTSRTAPAAVGTALTVGDWSIVVNGSTPNATQQVLARNQFNKPPAAGEQFFVVSISATYSGSDEPAQFFSDVTLKAVGASSVAYDSQSDCGIVPDEFDEFKDTFKGGTLTGNVCWSVKSTDASSLVMYGTQFPGKGTAWWALK
jgi:hypothetical protein